MNQNKTYFFIAATSIALLIVLAIQINWILQTAQIKEELFNEKANMVLSKTAQTLSEDKEMFKSMQVEIGKSQMHKMDSLICHFMQLYNIHINYSFEAQPTDTSLHNAVEWKPKFNSAQPGTYQACVEGEDNEKGILLKLAFPEKKQFILAEIGIPFIASVILISLVIILSWYNLLSLLKEKRIAEQTTDFLNNMTHEFKTPLTNIALASKMIVKGDNILQQEKIKHYAGVISGENEKLNQQVEQVLGMSALERGEILLNMERVNLHVVLENCVKRMGLQLENANGKINLQLNANRFECMVDKSHSINAFNNLLDNAIKYSQSNPELTIETFNRANKLIIKITDEGLGIDAQHHKKVFDKFFRVPTGNVHNVKGFGLGLSYVKKIIELHSGTISLESEKGKGAIFTIEFPYA